MLTAISRYGARVLPNTQELIAGCKARGEFIQGPDIARFEAAFAGRLGTGHAVAASYGRMAFYYVLKALDLPPGAEIVLPALTFWVVPEIARVAGLKVVFADVDPKTFTMDPQALERAITPATRAVVPTHLYGLSCDMDAIMAVAARHNLRVIEDCAHALGATFDGRPVGTFGDAGFFSFQTLKPLNCYGGGMALVRDAGVARRVRELAERERWPDEKRIDNRLLVGRLQRIFIKPWVFTISAFPILWVSSLIGANPDVYLWEEIRPLDPLPDAYTERFPNVQAALGLAALDHLDEWTDRTQASCRGDESGARRSARRSPCPHVPDRRTHVYYQVPACTHRSATSWSSAASGAASTSRRCTSTSAATWICLPAHATEPPGAPGARRAADAMQVPVYSTLTDEQAARVAGVVRSRAGRRARPSTSPW